MLVRLDLVPLLLLAALVLVLPASVVILPYMVLGLVLSGHAI